VGASRDTIEQKSDEGCANTLCTWSVPHGNPTK